MRTDFFKVDLLSPVHIGTGDELDPMSYLMRKENGAINCHVLDTNAWAREYPDPAELSTLFSGTNVPAMRGFLANHIEPALFGTRRLLIKNPKIYDEYMQKLSDQRTSHQLLFSPHTTCADRIPLIPGSSLKGSLRTAVIDWLDREKRLGLKEAREKDRKGLEYIRRLESALGPVTDSAFKQLKVGDVSGYSDSTCLVQPLELRRKQEKSATPKSMCEVLPSRLLGEEGRSILFLKIGLGSPLKAADNRLTLKNGVSWTWTELCELVTSYYRLRFEEEKTKFYGLSHFAPAKPAMESLEKEFNTAPGQMVLRVGHYSQVEFVTVRNNKPFTRKGKQGTPMPYGTTRTLADGLYPFGWIKLTPCSESEYRKGSIACEAANKASEQERIVRRRALEAERTQRLAETRDREEEAHRQAERERRQQAELEALPEDERNVLLLERGDLDEQRISALVQKIDSFDPQLQVKAAKALKELWISQKRWTKKECSKKQLIKVAAIKTILGEI
ncbi:RAMP superfamily CRISPR-associated protein [Desulfatitalea tepidiphila]|uniref:RAMP superfamily CRISPR-associated protein n=1 Tax=Desulfatitalea tepidiphila TaxID=1185843 RepID=UPI0006B61A44|nr:RAMP superfamily CRISPR-associated protein [Desulfatitalea tepidiphila]